MEQTFIQDLDLNYKTKQNEKNSNHNNHVGVSNFYGTREIEKQKM